MTPSHWLGRRVLVTGHTGFKGSWLTLILRSMGADVTGLALAPSTSPNLFDVLGLDKEITHVTGDIRDRALVASVVADTKADTVLHLAAQPLVRQSYLDPLQTYATNVMGTAHVLDAIRSSSSVRHVVSVTTDKCYENREWLWPYREDEALGGHDPYSSSKACAEHVTAAYRNSFLRDKGVHVASARAGNVIGGGDWAADRLLPDFFRSVDRGEPVVCRYPEAIRPWQHVLEPVTGYLALAEALFEQGDLAAQAWNFGPSENDAKPVGWILDRLTVIVGGPGWRRNESRQPHEAGLLKLDSSKARRHLSWRPRWHIEQALESTAAWHRAWKDGRDMREFTLAQIARFAETN